MARQGTCRPAVDHSPQRAYQGPDVPYGPAPESAEDSRPAVADGRACYESPPRVVLRDTGRLVMLAWERHCVPVPASLGTREVVKGSYGLYAIRTHPASASTATLVHGGRRDGDWRRPCGCLVSLPAGQTWPQGRAG